MQLVHPSPAPEQSEQLVPFKKNPSVQVSECEELQVTAFGINDEQGVHVPLLMPLPVVQLVGVEPFVQVNHEELTEEQAVQLPLS